LKILAVKIKKKRNNMFKKMFSSLKNNHSNDLSVAINSALNEVSAAVMMVDRDFMVTYVNTASKKLFTDHAEAFQTAFPHFDASKIVGTCIDVFHKKPEHQRKMLADTSKLPFQTDIKLGTLTIQLYVTATYDHQGQYSGNVLEWRDVTDDRKREIQDLDNAGQLAAINRSQGTIELGMDGKVLKINDNFLNVLGYTLNEVQAKSHRDFVDEAYRNSQEYQSFWDKLNRGENVSGQFKRFGKGGKEIWIEASYNPIFDPKGKPYKVVKYATDITENVKTAEMAKTLSLVANETDNSVLITDANGLIEFVNPGFTKLTGYTLNEVVGKKPGSFLQGSLTDKDTVKRISEKIKNQSPFYEEILNYDKNGNAYWISLAINPVKDSKGVLQKFVSIQTNINETKVKTVEFLSKLDAISKVSAVIEFTPDGKVTDANENFCQAVGYSLNEIKGQHHSMFVDSALKASPEYKLMWENLNRNQPQTGQFKRIAKSGKEIWLQANYNPIVNQEGKVIKVVKFATDITEQYTAAKALELAVAESQEVIEASQSGDLSQRISLTGKTGDIGRLCEGVNALLDKMSDVIAQISEAGETINTAANEISTGNSDLSVRTEQQASSLQNTAASMEELSSTVKQNAENAKQANQLAGVASGVAVKGGQVVGKVVTTMAGINESARKIEDIISVIDGIAFQTNILALNAAVEAARAGEQGRGFAVVAGEVRNLAQRSSSAAKEIKELISDSVGKVQEGTKLVEDAGATMTEIVNSVQRVTDIMSEITAASQEQSAGIDQVNNSVTSMDEATQQNAALVEEAAAAAESLVEQANSLMETVSAFRLAGGQSKARSQSSHQTSKPTSPQSRVKPSTTSAERRATNSPMRNSGNANSSTSNESKASAKTGTDDHDWEEF
jgi:methyl-accepting chemotaxis protein